MHISFPNSTSHTGLCVEKCKYGGAAANKCPEEAACHQVTEEARYGISPLFTNETLVAMGSICPARVDARESVTDCAPPPEPTPKQACEDTGISLQTAKIKCGHLIDAEQFYNDCLYDFCMGADPDGATRRSSHCPPTSPPPGSSHPRTLALVLSHRHHLSSPCRSDRCGRCASLRQARPSGSRSTTRRPTPRARW